MALQNLTFLEVDKRMPLMSLPVRTAIVQLETARVLFSPASTLTPAQLEEAGDITTIVAPSLLHTAGMSAAARAHPRAKLWGPVGARDKLPELHWSGTLGVDPWPYEEELSRVGLAGMPKVNESVFLHRASRSLLVTDIIFNIENPSGLGARFVLSVFGTYRKLGVSRLFLKLVKDDRAFRAAIAQVTALDFEHLVPSHGAIVMNEGKSRWLAAMRERRQLD
ncbi:MAG TPA: hypothetical protein VF794_10470 [Archangium sp.]|jgi:hypothetical protein|uniref:hypothetical protein n=1 Tax=Archangium sp. TaxID=1872627 RepID=UPI002EDA6E95